MDWMVNSCAMAAVQMNDTRKKERKSLFTGTLHG
jgi:hypothetical protein